MVFTNGNTRTKGNTIYNIHLAKAQHSAALAQLASKTCIVLRYGATSGEDPFAKVKGLIDRLGWGEMAVFWTEIQKTNKHRKKKNTEKAEQINAMYCISYLYCLVFLTPECSRDVEWDPKP